MTILLIGEIACSLTTLCGVLSTDGPG